jgi:threonine dehydratase
MRRPLYTTIFAGHESVRQAHGIIKPHIRETGVERARALESDGGEVWLKLECHQVTGSFKARGALHRLSVLSDQERLQGVIGCSAGNHGLGVAMASEIHGVASTIFLPRSVDPARKRMLEDYSCSVHVIGDTYDDCEAKARQVAKETGRTFISPYNDPWVIAGQGTIGIELLEQVPHLDVVLVAVGGGGLVAGVAAYLKAVKPSIRVVGVSPANSAGMYDKVTGISSDFVAHLETLSDSTAGSVEEGALTIDMCKALVDQWILVEERDISAAMRYLFFEHRLVVEGAGALSVAAYLKERERLTDYTCALLMCGSNIDPTAFIRIVDMKSSPSA